MSKTIGVARTVRLAVLFLAFVLFVPPAGLSAFDFGLLLNQRGWLGGDAGDEGTRGEYEASLMPRLSILVGDSIDLFFSASLKAIYRNVGVGDGWAFVPELLRNEFVWSFDNIDLRMGRMAFADPMGIVATGLFDGASGSLHTMMGTFSAGVWYTGLLYKNRARISMTADDATAMQAEVDWGNFADTYFASRRLMVALNWEHPSVADLFGLGVALVAQADLNNADNTHHSQYLIAKAFVPIQRFIFELGGALETAQVTDGADFRVGLAGDIAAHWMPPVPFHSMVSFAGRFTSGRAETGPLSAFTPITALPHGSVLQAPISGLSMLSLGYTARLHRTFSASLAVSHFVRSDRGTYMGYPLGGEPSDNYFLGTEFFGRAIWSPFSDISLNLGVGAFLPALGNVEPEAGARWRAEMSLALMFR